MARIKPARDAVLSGAPTGDQAQTAAYVAALTADLAVIARRHNLGTLGYLLDMARLEAEGTVQGTDRVLA